MTVDFSGDHELGIAGIGIVIQEATLPRRRGQVVGEVQEAVRGLDLKHGEKYAVLRALEIAIERGFKNLKIRSDYNAMRRALKLRYQEAGRPPRDAIEERIKQLAGQLEKVHFGYVPRRKNQRAHHLSREARMLPPQEVPWSGGPGA